MRRIKNLLKKGTSLVLVMAMLMGLCSTAFAAGAKNVSAPLYVSLGDSMANGYGLPGYDDPVRVNGYKDEVRYSYPALFADAFGFNHVPMAISAMRAEDLHFILEFPYWDAEALAVAEGAWDEDAWNAMFSTGDYYTYDEFTDSNGRFHDYAGKNTAVVAEEMQTAVAEADIISLGIGNANFGVFALGRVVNALGIFGETKDESWIQLERALAECDEETRVFALNLYDELKAVIDEEVTENELADVIVNSVMYTIVSYMLNYAGVVDRIVELNPDAEIMLVGLMNTMHNMKIAVGGRTVNFGRLMNMAITAMNTYLSGLPTVFQLIGRYADATFYYAEASNVEMIYTELAGEELLNDVVRTRVIEEVNNRVFPLLGDFGFTQEVSGIEVSLAVEPVTLAKVERYEDRNYDGLTANEMLSCAVYLAFEQAVREAAGLKVLDASAFMSLAGGLTSVFDGLNLDFVKDLVDDDAKNVILTKVLSEYTGWQYKYGADITQACMNFLEDQIEKAAKTMELEGGITLVDGYLALLNGVIDELKNRGVDTDLEDREEADWDALYALLTTTPNKTDVLEMFNEDMTDVKTVVDEAVAKAEQYGMPAPITWADVEESFYTAWEVYYGKFNAIYSAYMTTLESNEMYLPLLLVIDASVLSNLNVAIPTEVMGWIELMKADESMAEHKATVGALVNGWATKSAAEVVAPKLTDPLAENLTANPALEGLLHLFARMLVGNGIGCHPNANGHQTIANAVIKSYDEDYTAKDATLEKAQKAFNKLASIIENNYERAYRKGYTYAEPYFDKAVVLLNKLDAKFEALQVRVEKTSHPITDEFRYEVVMEIENAQETIAELIALLETNDANIAMDQVAVLMCKLEEHIDRILNIMDVAIDDVSAAVYAELVELATELNTYVETEVLPAIDEAIREAYEYAMAYLHELAEEAYAEFVAYVTEMYPVVKAYLEDRAYEIYDLIITYGPEVAEKVVFALLDVVAEYGPEVADWTYDFLYNNPDKVIAFCNEYGDDILPYAVAIMGFIVTNYGEEIAQFVYENRCEILTMMIEWMQIHGENTWALIVVYLDELGVLDQIPSEFDEVMELLPGLVDLLVKYGPEFLEKTGLRAALEELAYAVEGQIGDEMRAAIARIEAILNEIEEQLGAELNEENLLALLAELEDAVNELVELAENQANELVKAAVAEFERAYFSATHATYERTVDSYYVAIGDATVSGYAGLLAAELGLTAKYTDISADSAAGILAELTNPMNLMAVAGADLITVGFSNTTFLSFVTDQLYAYLSKGMEPAEMDWTAVVGAEGEEYVQMALDEIYAELVEQGLDNTVPIPVPMNPIEVNLADMLMLAIESYAYTAVSYACTYPTLVEGIRTVNSDALIVVVGMSNTMADIELDMSDLTNAEGDEFAIGEYVQYLIDVVNGEALIHAMLSENVIYVDAPNVDIVADEDAYDSIMEFVLNGVMNLGSNQWVAGMLGLSDIGSFDKGLAYTDEGYAYIVEQIMNALTVMPEYLLGDVNGDGEIKQNDVSMLFKHLMGRITLTGNALLAGDIDGNGEIKQNDVSMLFKYLMGRIDSLG